MWTGVIDQVHGITQTRLAPFVQTDKANLTKLLQQLEARGLIERRTGLEDLRVKACFLTDQGKSLVPALHERLNRWEDECFSGVSAQDRLQFEKTSQQITRNLFKHV
jgi:DNA-binding MarR family transcriptional regulator